jgi:hypothetical protein
MRVVRVFGLWGRLFVFAQCVAGPILVGISLILTVRTEVFLHRCIPTSGTIERNVLIVERNGDGSVNSTYAPVFRFTSRDGRAYTVTSGSSSSPPEFAAGQHVRVLYEPSDPTAATIDSFLQLWMKPIVLAGVGIASSALGYGLLFVLRRRKVRLIPSLAQS